jgi:hypothetical protein
MSIHADGIPRPLEEVRPSVALRDSGVPAGKMGSVGGAGMLKWVWKSWRIVLASEKSSDEPARCGCVAYSREADTALSGFGIEL